MSTLRANKLESLDGKQWSPSQSVDSVDALRAATFGSEVHELWLSGYYGVGTAGGGPLYRDSADTTTGDNGQTVFVDGEGVRWKTQEISVHNIPGPEVPLRTYVDNVRGSFGSNATVFTAHQIHSKNGNQYMAYWRKDDEKLVVARRALPDGEWDRYTFDGLGGRPNIELATRDSHWICSLGIDANERVIIVYNTRNNEIKWRYSEPENHTAWSSEQTGMTGANETSATYPTFVYGPADELLLMYREGVFSDGDLMLNAWSAGALAWSARAHPVVQGTDTIPTTNPYWWTPPVTADGAIHLFFNWRGSGGVESNFGLNYARSFDGGATWERSNGVPYTLPITQTNAEVVDPIPEGSNLLNQGNAAEDEQGNPICVYHKNDQLGMPQIFIARLLSGAWQIEPVTDRSMNYSLDGAGTRYLPQARPGVLVYQGNKVVVITRDWEFGGGLQFYAQQDGRWVLWGPASENLNGWEPQWDRQRFLESSVLDIIITPVSDQNNEPDWDYEVPYEVWTYPTLSSLPRDPVGRIDIVATMGRWGQELTTESATLTDTAASFALSRPMFPRFPTMARYVARVENDVNNTDPVSLGLSLGGQAQGVTFAVRTTPDGNKYIIDSGWRKIPHIDDLPFSTEFINVLLAAPDGGTARVTAFTLALGAVSRKVEVPQ